jgi:N-terminal acetyltransferase B complex non-catalytic subunit
LGKQLDAVQKIEDSAPTCQLDLHILYTSQELGTTVINFSERVSKSIKDSRLRAEWENLKTAEAGQNLILEVMQKSAEIKRNLDEGGLIDWILEALLKEDDEEAESAVGMVLKEVVDENFMELWAGEVVESWNDSIVGFSYFRLPETLGQK